MPVAGNYFELPTGTSYEILEVKESRSIGWYRVLILRVDRDSIPEQATVIPMVWLRRKRTMAK